MRAFIAVFALLAPVYAAAYSLSPMVAELTAEGREASRNFLVQNPADAAVPLQVSMFQRSLDVDGHETRVKTDDFQFFPAQFVLKPGESRNIRVSYQGPRELETERAYRLVVEQLPVELKKPEKKSAQVQLDFTMSFVASVYVTAKAAGPAKLRIEAFRPLSKTAAELQLVNEGKTHLLLHDVEKITVTGEPGAPAVELGAPELKALESEVLLAGGSRKLKLEWSREIAWPARPKAEPMLRK